MTAARGDGAPLATRRLIFTAATPRLGTALRKGVRLTFSCPAPCTASATLSLGAAEARRLGLARTVASGTKRFAKAGAAALTVTFGKRAKRRLAARQRLALTLRLRVTGHPPATRRLTLRR